MSLLIKTNRRLFLGSLGVSLFMTKGLFAEVLTSTPSLTEGPFYPDKIPLDKDNDLIIVGDHTTPAVGEITNLTGRVLSPSGEPMKDATIEIWQCDGNAVYLHSADSGRNATRQDKNFQGFGSFTTGSSGEYRFRTIKPVAYPGRPAGHIHVKVKKGDKELLTTQIFVRGAEGNKRDGVFNQMRDAAKQELVLADFKAVPGSKMGELAANFDIVLGATPDDRGFRRGGGPPGGPGGRPPGPPPDGRGGPPGGPGGRPPGPPPRE